MTSLGTLLPKDAPVVVGVLNVTPDSFSDRGRYLDVEAAVTRALEMLEGGAKVIDIGGEATGPASQPISAEDELRRIETVVARLAPRALLSIDSYHSKTAARCLELGAAIINDTSALRGDPEMTAVVRDARCHVVLMFAKGAGPLPHAGDGARPEGDIVEVVSRFLLTRAEVAIDAGIAADRIVLDPGMGRFLSDDPADSWELLRRFDELYERLRPFPVMIGASRKGFLGGTLADRDPISQLAALHAVRLGARLVRTHRPEMMAQFLAAERVLAK